MFQHETQPATGLIQCIRLFKSSSGTLVGSMGNGWILLLKPVEDGVYIAYLGPESSTKHYWGELYPRGGYISGCFGCSRLIVKNQKWGIYAYFGATESGAKDTVLSEY